MSDTTIMIVWPDDDHVEVHVNGTEVASANHDEHGWSGMDAIVNTATSIARAAGIPVTTEGVPNV